MADYKLLLPKMGESVIEATVLSWNKKVGDKVNENEIILEVATDKVDSEVPSPVTGVIKQLLHEVNDVVGVGQPLAVIEIEGEAPVEVFVPKSKEEPVMAVATAPAMEEKPAVSPSIAAEKKTDDVNAVKEVEKTVTIAKAQTQAPAASNGATTKVSAGKFYSPLVLNVAQVEGVSMQELESISGTGADGRVTKEDILGYIDKKKKGILPSAKPESTPKQQTPQPLVNKAEQQTSVVASTSGNNNVEIIEMDRMRKLIAQHMVNSINTSAHVSSFVECDVTNIVRWREKHKQAFQKREGFSLSFMPIFVEAISKAIKDYPMINISVEGDKILLKKDVNIGIATALPSGNLIVPVVKNCDQKSILGIAKAINAIVQKARTNSLQPDDISNGTYTISNIGTFGNIIGTPIINQPQVAIMAVGSITKKPVVLEVDGQDVIAIRHMMYLSHTYDHRVVDGQLGGLFVKRVAELLEKFDIHQEV